MVRMTLAALALLALPGCFIHVDVDKFRNDRDLEEWEDSGAWDEEEEDEDELAWDLDVDIFTDPGSLSPGDTVMVELWIDGPDAGAIVDCVLEGPLTVFDAHSEDPLSYVFAVQVDETADEDITLWCTTDDGEEAAFEGAIPIDGEGWSVDSDDGTDDDDGSHDTDDDDCP